MRISRHAPDRRSRRWRAVGVGLTALGCLSGGVMVLSSGASAAPPERESFHDEVTNVIEDFCDVPGLTVELSRIVDGRGSAQARGRDGLIYFMEHLVIEDTLTEVVNGQPSGESLRVVERTLNKDLSVTDNGDGTLTILVLATGQSSLYDSSGKAIARNPGQVRFELLIDHGGTPTDPDDDEEIGFTLVKGSTGRSDDYCEAIVDQFT